MPTLASVRQVTTDHVDIGAELHSTEEMYFDVGKVNQANFHLPTEDTGVLAGEEVQAAVSDLL